MFPTSFPEHFHRCPCWSRLGAGRSPPARLGESSRPTFANSAMKASHGRSDRRRPRDVSGQLSHAYSRRADSPDAPTPRLALWACAMPRVRWNLHREVRFDPKLANERGLGAENQKGKRRGAVDRPIATAVETRTACRSIGSLGLWGAARRTVVIAFSLWR